MASSPSTYGTHQLQLKWDMHGTRRGHASCTHMFLSYAYTQLHVLSITIVHRVYSSLSLATCKVLFYTHTRVLAMTCVTTTCTSIELPQPDQVMHAVAFNVLIINAGYNCLYLALIIGTLISGWHLNWSGYVRLVSNVKTLKNYRLITVKVFS